MKAAYFLWATVLMAAAGALVIEAAPPEVQARILETARGLLTTDALAVAAAAFVCEYVDATLGMGYGTTLTPLLLLLGHAAHQIVPAVLLSQLLTGVTSAFLHHGAGNVSFRRGTRARKIALVLAGSSVVGTIVASSIAVRLSTGVLRAAIAVVIVAVGVVTLVTIRRTIHFSWRRIWVLGSVAAFNKGLSGGGYGPIVTGGQLVSGVDAKSAIGITALAEGMTCFLGFAIYAWSVGIDARLALPLVVGSMLSVPLAVLSVRALPVKGLRIAIGVMTLVLGAAALLAA